MCYPFSTMLMNISGCWIQGLLHHLSFRKPTGETARGEDVKLQNFKAVKQRLAVIPGPLWVVWHGLIDEVTSNVDDVRTFMVDLGRL